MSAHKASLINAVVLIVFGLWGYLGSTTPSLTSIIPVVFGLLLLLLNNGVKKENKIVAHIAVLLTVIIFAGLFMPLMGAIDRSDNPAVFRIATMLFFTVMAIVYFIKSFVNARKAKKDTSP
jgi:apolipoprotein N-acyltransferase